MKTEPLFTEQIKPIDYFSKEIIFKWRIHE